MTDVIVQLINEHQASNKGFVIFRWPNDKKIHFISGNKSGHEDDDVFVYAPFDNKNKKLFIKKERQEHFENIDALLDGLSDENKSRNELIIAHENELRSTSFEEYKNGFNSIQKDISEGIIQKAILSRIIRVDAAIKHTSTFRKILEGRPAALCYCFFHADAGCWMGASPELIVREKDGRCKTSSIAGTKASKDIAWTAKENKEQQIVTNYIQEQLSIFGLQHEVKPVNTVQAGNVFHLKQIIEFDLENNSFKAILDALHPTPAISGFPKAEAIKSIAKAEGHDRSYYSGYLGELGVQPRIYVNIRCAQFFQDSVNLYVGGGLTADSNLEAEWQECEKKAQGLSSLL